MAVQEAEDDKIGFNVGLFETQFYFSAYTDHSKANASELARLGEQNQYDQLVASGDFLLLGSDWEKKRHERYRGTNYSLRTAPYRHEFQEVFDALESLTRTKVSELQPWIQRDPGMDLTDAVRGLKAQKITALQTAFKKKVLSP